MTRDLRKYASQTNVQLIVGALLILFIVGLGLIAWIYGAGAPMGFLCLLGCAGADWPDLPVHVWTGWSKESTRIDHVAHRISDS